MNVTQSAADVRHEPAGFTLVGGIILAALTEAIAGTTLSLGRNDIIGDTYATPDEFAWLDTGYTALKLIGFLTAPWLMNRLDPRRLIIGATLTMGCACGFAAATTSLELLVALRLIQGFAGGLLLVCGQTIIFLAYPRSWQPILQAVFAIGAVVAPATMAPALQGWLLDSQSWAWIFFSVVPVAMAAVGLLLVADVPSIGIRSQRAFDAMTMTSLAVALFCASYVLSQGSRWDWFENGRIVWLTATGVLALLAFVYRLSVASKPNLLDLAIFRSGDFCFAFIVSFVAGAALFGSAYLIPSFAVAVLAFTPTAAGQLLLPSGALFVGTLLLAAVAFQFGKLPPIATVPFGILSIMAAMWMLSTSTLDSGADSMMPAILLRGFGLGLLFLSITLVAFTGLDDSRLADGIGLFNAGRQLGGLIGVAGLQTLIDHNTAMNFSVIGASVTAELSIVSERLASTAALLVAKGMDPSAASWVATSLLGRTVSGQSTVIAFETAFNAVALLFVVAAPFMIAIKIGLKRFIAKPT